jgi:hypothetical protein
MVASAPPPPVEPSGSLVVRFGTAVGLAAAAALACSLPAALRVASAAGGAGFVRVWLALAAAGLGPMIGSVVVLRGAREGLRAFAGPGSGLRAFGIGLWLASMLVVLSVFGSVLRATTHHHGLAGVTFALGALAVAAGAGLVCARLVALVRARAPQTQRVLVALLGGVAVLALAWVGLRFVRAVSHDASPSAEAALVVDVLAFVLAALFASRRSLVARRALAYVGPPVAVVVAALGIHGLRDAPVHDAIDERAPAFAAPADIVSGR